MGPQMPLMRRAPAHLRVQVVSPPKKGRQRVPAPQALRCKTLRPEPPLLSMRFCWVKALYRIHGFYPGRQEEQVGRRLLTKDRTVLGRPWTCEIGRASCREGG